MNYRKALLLGGCLVPANFAANFAAGSEAARMEAQRAAIARGQGLLRDLPKMTRTVVDVEPGTVHEEIGEDGSLTITGPQTKPVKVFEYSKVEI